jgi:hypothetical protein
MLRGILANRQRPQQSAEQPATKANRALQDILDGRDQKGRARGLRRLYRDLKTVECLIKNRNALLAFYDFPAEHWKHLRTTNGGAARRKKHGFDVPRDCLTLLLSQRRNICRKVRRFCPT